MLSFMQGVPTFFDCEIVTFADWKFNEECR